MIWRAIHSAVGLLITETERVRGMILGTDRWVISLSNVGWGPKSPNVARQSWIKHDPQGIYAKPVTVHTYSQAMTRTRLALSAGEGAGCAGR